jgi:hypothetical protein
MRLIELYSTVKAAGTKIVASMIVNVDCYMNLNCTEPTHIKTNSVGRRIMIVHDTSNGGVTSNARKCWHMMKQNAT